MSRVKFIRHNGKRILMMDYSNSSKAEAAQAFEDTQPRAAGELREGLERLQELDVEARIAIAAAYIEYGNAMYVASSDSAVTEALRQLREDGLAILYISHRMHEIEALADTCSVFRNGTHIETFASGAKTDANPSMRNV